MAPANRVKFGLLTLAALLLTAFAWSAAQGQFRPPVVRPPVFRPPVIRPPIINPPQFNPPGMPGGGATTQTVWTCPTCNYVYRGLVPPSTCPGCQKQMSNGVGNGIRGPGGAMIPPTMPGINPPVMNPPVMNPPIVNQPPVTQPPAFNPPAPANNGNAPGSNVVVNLNPVSDPAPAANAVDSSSSSSSGETKSSKRWMVGLVIGIIVVGVFVLLGGTFLVIYSMRSGDSTPRKGRRRRRDDYDD